MKGLGSIPLNWDIQARFALTVIALIGLLAGSCKISDRQDMAVGVSSDQAVTSSACPADLDELKTMFSGILDKVEPWPEHQIPGPHAIAYSQSNWNGLVSAAKLIQSQNSNVVVEILNEYQKAHTRGSRTDDSKLLLLLRVVFDLSNAGEEAVWLGRGAWIDHSGNDKIKMSPEWPVTWRNGKPELLVGFTTYQGRLYSAANEYSYFLSKYPKRDLRSF